MSMNNDNKKKKQALTIRIKQDVFDIIKKQGLFGESINDVLLRLLTKNK